MIDIYEFMTWTQEERQAHLDLSTPCEYRDTNSTECRGILAVYLNTNVPKGRGIHCCHACHDGRCSNVKHLYWGTSQENAIDAYVSGATQPPVYERPRGRDHRWFGLPPWRSPNAKRFDWGLASTVYDHYMSNGLTFGKYGYGYKYAQNRFGLCQMPARSMIRKFSEGWNPYEDPLWLEDFGALA